MKSQNSPTLSCISLVNLLLLITGKKTSLEIEIMKKCEEVLHKRDSPESQTISLQTECFSPLFTLYPRLFLSVCVPSVVLQWTDNPGSTDPEGDETLW